MLCYSVIFNDWRKNINSCRYTSDNSAYTNKNTFDVNNYYKIVTIVKMKTN